MRLAFSLVLSSCHLTPLILRPKYPILLVTREPSYLSLIKILLGETVPLDGVVHQGKASIDTSMMTGEPYPVRKKEGEHVSAGTLVLDGTILIRTTHSSEDTLLANIIQLVEDAQMGKAPIQRLVDRVASVFVPVVVVFAFTAAIFWWLYPDSASYNPMDSNLELAMMVLVSTLVIACPCALGLATPTAIMVGTGRGAQLGVLIRNGEALESTRRISHVVLDKTGTITTGEISLSSIEAVGDTSDAHAAEVLGALGASRAIGAPFTDLSHSSILSPESYRIVV